jgi:diguanylate cyclase (GGDEF)-like protein
VSGLTAEARETSGATTGGLLRYVRSQGGDEAVARVLDSAGVPFTAAEFDDQSRWWSYDTRIRLFAAATEVLDDPDTMFKVGASALHTGLAHALVLLLRAMGSPRQVFQRLPRAVAKFSTTSTMEIVESGAVSATIRYRLHDGYVHSRLDCEYAQGLITTVPTVFGLPAARIVHDECESDGSPACIYDLSWDRRGLLRRRRRDDATVHPELTALRGQLRTLQSAATELVGSDDLDSVLHRIVARAAEAVVAPAYLLAVTRPAGGPPLVHSSGLPADEVPAMVAALLEGGDLGGGAVVVDVASARRSHGRLAALYPAGYGAMGDEASMLGAYAGHAAAALDLLTALEDSRLEADRARALLSLAHELSTADGARKVCAVVVEALPRIVGCSSAGILLWDSSSGRLQTAASFGLDENVREVMTSTSLSPEETPELVGMLSDREPRILSATDGSAVLQTLLRSLGVTDAVAVPLLAGTTFLGVATASWAAGQAPGHLRGDALARLRGVGDQASTALQNARLLETVRHQASHDPLTGLPNRVLFLDRLERALRESGPDRRVAVLFCDLDRFKDVNDSRGHAAGDELLRQVAARLRAGLRPEDTVGRLSGDEFAMIVPGLVDDEAAGVVDRVLGCFVEPFRVEGDYLTVGTSVGVAMHRGAPHPGALHLGTEAAAEQLLREADAAMYRHKQGHGRRSTDVPAV